jgi:hypothetical protein
MGKPNLRCPRNGKWTHRKAPLPSQPLSVLNTRLGRRWRLIPPARIPANTVAARLENVLP